MLGNRGDCFSPLRVPAWAIALCGHPDPEFVEAIVRGLRDGFRIGFDRASPLVSAVRNMPSAAEHDDAVSEYVDTELRKRHFLGPYSTEEFAGGHINRIGVIPKGHTPGKWRIITDLSFPTGGSVNDGIDPLLCSLSYVSVDEVAAIAAGLGRGALLAKIDIESAYRLVPVHPDDRYLLGVRWKGKIVVDGMLPFGLRSAPKIFTLIADALEWVVRKAGVRQIAHYLDDFVVIGRPASDECAESLRKMTELCAILGVPLAKEKSEGPSTSITFLGIQLDTESGTLALPPAKLQRICDLLNEWGDKKVCSRRELESLIGVLNHACKVVRPGRSFLRRLIDLLAESRVTFARRPHHSIRLNRAFRSDIAWWRSFIVEWNGVGFFPRVNMDGEHRVTFVTDASGAWGCGARWGTHWFQLAWDAKSNPSPIAVKELIPIVLAAAVWGKEWRGGSVTCRCDNQTVVSVLASRSSRNAEIMHLLRCLFFIEARMQFTLHCVHLPGVENTVADALSRNDLVSFRSQAPEADRDPQVLPESLVEALLLFDQDWLSPTWRRLFGFISIKA